MIRLLIACVVFLGTAALASAQVVPEQTLSWDVEFWAAGVNPATGSPIQAANILKSASTCNLTPVPVPTGVVLNPTKIYVDDPDNAGRSCQLAPTTSAGLLMSVPLGSNHFATARARGATLVSARSAASNPFSRAIVPAPPPVPTAVAVTP